MKKTFTILILITFFSCEKDDGFKSIEIDNSPLTHAELGFELDEPDIILNELSKGKLDKQINSILLVMYENTYRKWEFEYIDNSDILSKMIFYLPHYQGCEQNIYEFSYNENNLIDKVISTRENVCNEYEVIKTYTFNYNDNGLLKSVFMDNESFVEENYFGYYPNGKIKEIYSDHRGRGVEPSFGVQKFTYNDSFTNVIEVESIGASTHYTYKYFYDNNTNPYKDFFIASSVFMPFIGPAYLSENNVIEMIEKNENNIHNQEFSTEFIFNYSNSNSLINYSYLDNERVFNINQ
ncbi:hypothetical protein H8K90_14160 [Winogradskyella echinorum]|uniref:YD repeat-containing protein n=1 Tax=Winogradskyella echinorum TaxID=538189 RepID=A0ABR6Y485_9FLAO|nr:hypothetical protein [Winogradskyella echinorum]MBC3847537.1 hypothetical protein [Winogradskyella echinorum]MBC5751885.1 hypothetical protein [Winogradskyella echinorum]